jgi:hypothetical protein
MSEAASKPVHVHRSGALSASVWQREHNGQIFYNVTCQRAFTRDEGKTWEYSENYGRDDLPVVSALMIAAWNTIRSLENKARELAAK